MSGTNDFPPSPETLAEWGRASGIATDDAKSARGRPMSESLPLTARERELLDRAERAEQEAAELRAQVREWVCPSCRVVHPVDAAGRLPKGPCGHYLTPYGSWKLQQAEQEAARERARAEKWKALYAACQCCSTCAHNESNAHVHCVTKMLAAEQAPSDRPEDHPDCPTCGGYGRIEVRDEIEGGIVIRDGEAKCTDCNGGGKV